MDMFVVPTISFRLLYGLLILQHTRRQLVWLGVTAHPNAEWIARQLTEAYGWKETPQYLVRDRDCAYGEVFIRRVGAMGIRDRPNSPRSPWQNGYAEAIGSIRRDCLDHVVVFSERHLRHVLASYQQYYNEARTHLSLGKDAPAPRKVQAVGRVLALPNLGGLHHQYVRVWVSDKDRIAHLMFELPLWQLSSTLRTGTGQWLAEAVATFGLLLTIFGCMRGAAGAIPYAVGLYITAAYWFTASTSFANPAVTIARAMSDTFAGIAPTQVFGFIVAQIIGALGALLLAGWMWRPAASTTSR